MRTKILKHVQTVNDMIKAHIPYTFVRKFGEDECAQVSKDILKYKICGIVEEMPEEGKNYIMEDTEIIPYLKQMEPVLDKTAFWRLASMFCQAGKEKITELECQDIQEVILDEEIPKLVQYNFLKYFKHLELTEEERRQVLESLEKYGAQVKIEMGQLTAKERAILLHPLFTAGLLNHLWNIRDVWTVLGQPGVLSVLQAIHDAAYPYQWLDESQFRQLAENPGEIEQLLENVLAFLAEEQCPELVKRWLENGALLPDLKRLVKLLPDMEENQKEKILRNRVAYVCCVYQVKMDRIDMEELSYLQEDVLLYAIVTGKRHFLKLVDENSEDFLSVRRDSLLLEPDIYRNYLNLNTLNEKNLRDSYDLKIAYKKGKEYLDRKSYTFEELKMLAPLQPYYYQLYGFLTNDRSDERMRILRELVKRDCVPYPKEEDGSGLKNLARRLSEKPLSVWMREELGHVKDLDAHVSVELLTDWEDYQRFIPGINNERQAIYLVRNRDILSKYETLDQFQESMLQDDETWLWLKENLSITDEFVKRYEGRVRQFVYNGEAEIVRQFCMETEHKLETVRRLLTAELMGEFEKLKYHEEDLEREIAYPVPVEVEDAWKDNLSRSVDDCRIWEEDRFIPVLQIGEIPIHTCISYRGGVNKECLLSCFDANKKVIYLEKNGRIVFRALIRLTKGSVTEKPIRAKRVEFVDLTKENGSMEGIEELILFLERPYFGGISEEQENEVVSCVYQMVREKAKRMRARVVISKSYEKYAASKEYELMDYYVYISASKNGKQYLDSLYGEATVSDSGTYGKNKFLMVCTEKREIAA